MIIRLKSVKLNYQYYQESIVKMLSYYGHDKEAIYRLIIYFLESVNFACDS